MKVPVHISKRFAVVLVMAAAVVVAAELLESGRSHGQATGANTSAEAGAKSNPPRPKRPWTCRPAN